MYVIKRPIILLGFQRSGTTMLGKIFQQHPQIAYWVEPRNVWMHSFIYRSTDILTETDASPKVVNQIRRDMQSFLDKSGRQRFAEKTPSNMVRLPFIRKVFPDCQVIHIIRDGRASTYSTLQKLSRPTRTLTVKRRMKETPLWHYPAYIPKIWQKLVLPHLFGVKAPYWGTLIPGLEKWAKTLTPEEMCARQWQETLRIALRDAASYPPDQYREWRYERLVAEPVQVIREMFEFVHLDWPDGFDKWLAENIHGRSVTKWREHFSDAEIGRITAQLEPLLSELGYRND